MESVQMASRHHQCTRGVFGLRSWSPCRVPACWANIPHNTDNNSPLNNNNQTVKPEPDVPDKKALKLIAKNSYQCNSESPLGTELSLRVGEIITQIEVHAHGSWILVLNEKGEQGYVPANHVTSHTVSSLPWLHGRKPAEAEEDDQEAEDKQKFAGTGTKKQTYTYKPSYSHESLPAGGDSLQYYCKLCDKKLNGPQPYASHMASKAHKAEEQLAREYGDDLS